MFKISACSSFLSCIWQLAQFYGQCIFPCFQIPNAAPSGPPKRTKPSESGSGSCTLESVSESEEATGPYQRAMTLRKRTQNNEKESNVFTDSSAEELETFEDESSKPLYRESGAATVLGADEAVNEKPVIAARNDDEKKGHRFGAIRKLLGKGRGDHGSERRKSIAARRSVSKARRLRRKSGTSGGQLSHARPETEDVKKKSGLYTSVYKKERSATSSQDEASSQMPSERTLSAKALIAAAEARDMETLSKTGAAKKDLLKRKADAISDDAKAQRSVRRRSIKPNYRTNRSFLFRRQVNVAATKKKLGLI